MTDATTPDAPFDRGLRIVAKRDGFRRAGMAHHGTADHPPGTFTHHQVDQLKGEPMLVVTEIEVDESGGDKGSKPATKGGVAPRR